MDMQRSSGVLLHISSLPTDYGVGDFGPEAYKFVDFLVEAGQRHWQILPLTPTELTYGNSPYSGPSVFAGNRLFISPQMLLREGLLSQAELASLPAFLENKTDYEKAIPFKDELLKKAFKNYQRKKTCQEAFERFCAENAYWLQDYALYILLKETYEGKPWNQWPEDLKRRNGGALEKMRADHGMELEEVCFFQFLFYSQWDALKKYCQKNGIDIIGDIPIYVNFDSAEVWTNPELFKLDKNLDPEFVAGVPPDYFSATGQRWGNPVYRWPVIRKQGYRWWLKRMEHTLKLYDWVRIDHFRGFVAYWQIPAQEKTAMRGQWIKAPGPDFFKKVKARFPNAGIIAEDVGYITEPVRKLIKDTGFPGMKILQFAFGDSQYDNNYLPSTYSRNCVAYTGTHDNTTTVGWFLHEVPEEQRLEILNYIGGEEEGGNIHWRFIKVLMKSKADMVIFPMQDVLGLGDEAKMNKPATVNGNWQWRLDSVEISRATTEKLKDLTISSSRAR